MTTILFWVIVVFWSQDRYVSSRRNAGTGQRAKKLKIWLNFQHCNVNLGLKNQTISTHGILGRHSTAEIKWRIKFCPQLRLLFLAGLSIECPWAVGAYLSIFGRRVVDHFLWLLSILSERELKTRRKEIAGAEIPPLPLPGRLAFWSGLLVLFMKIAMNRIEGCNEGAVRLKKDLL